MRLHFDLLLEVSFQVRPNSKFLKTSLTQVGSSSIVIPTASLTIWWRYEIFNASENFRKSATLDT